MMNKKGQSLGGLYAGVITIAAIGLLLVILLLVLNSINTSMLIPNTAVTVVNETNAWLNSSGYHFSDATGKVDFAITSINQVMNQTEAFTLTAANYTYSGQYLYNLSAQAFTNVNISYSYTYSMNTTASDATQTIATQFISFLPWLGIILLVIAAGVVLFFVIRSFTGSGMTEGA
jgi:hypothetical protein